MSKKLSYISQIEVVEYNMRRLKTLIEADFEPHSEVNLYCIKKSQLQLANLEEEIFGKVELVEVKGLSKEASEENRKAIIDGR